MNRRIIFFGCTKLSKNILESLIEEEFNITAIFSIPKKFKISYNENRVKNINYASLSSHAQSLGIPFYEVDSVEGKRMGDYKDIIDQLKPDVIIAIGWYYMVPKEIRDIPKEGVWGIHASLLPNYAGGAPLVWAIINGETETGVTLFRMESGVDDGDIISQEKLKISDTDTIKTMLEKTSSVSKKIIIKQLKKNIVNYTPQDKSKIKIFPQRSSEDGEIDWSWDKTKILNFVRAQTRPYPGAYTILNNKKIILWDISID